jgi:hypothetical protein
VLFYALLLIDGRAIFMWYIGFILIVMYDFQDAEIERRIEQETKAEKHIQKLLLLGTPDLNSISYYLCCFASTKIIYLVVEAC